jgi:membrane protease YdiL (CAAX protease family)
MGLLNSGLDVRNVLYVYLALAFAPMMTVFHHRTLRTKVGDFRGSILYFAAFFAVFMAVPLLIILVCAPRLGDFLWFVGLTAGHAGTGLLLTAVAVPVALAIGLIGSHDPAMREQYPFSKQACSNARRFVLYEIAYLFLYYIPWEFLFRGILFFPLVPLVGLIPALAVQTIASTLYHFTHPASEIVSAVAGGFIFGLVAYFTGSIFYTAAIHAMVGLASDTFICLRRRRAGAGA